MSILNSLNDKTVGMWDLKNPWVGFLFCNVTNY